MTVPKTSNTRRDSRTLPAAPRRLSSQSQLRAPLLIEEGVEAPPSSTLPPPPFQHESAVPELEWWLDGHMALAADLAWLEQLLDGGDDGPHAETLRQLAGLADGVRDALYELYCDAADRRLSSLVGTGSALEQHVLCSYAWCARVVQLLGVLVHGLRAGDPDWKAAKAAFQDVAAMYVADSEPVRSSVRALSIDSANPVEPLRNLPGDVEKLFTAIRELEIALEKRFA